MAKDNTENRSRIRAGAASAALPRATGSMLPIRWPAVGLAAGIGRVLSTEVERRRLFPWLPVAFGLGILLFFEAEGEPALWAPLLGTKPSVIAVRS
jgi:competence protein ComEC